MANSMMRRRLRALPQPPGFGQDECERYAAKARKVMARVDALPPRLRAAVYSYGANPVLGKVAEGAREADILAELAGERRTI